VPVVEDSIVPVWVILNGWAGLGIVLEAPLARIRTAPECAVSLPIESYHQSRITPSGCLQTSSPVAEHSFRIGVIQAKCERTTQHVWHIPLTAFEGQLPLGRWLVWVEGSASQ
jgi:hypothetical protein